MIRRRKRVWVNKYVPRSCPGGLLSCASAAALEQVLAAEACGQQPALDTYRAAIAQLRPAEGEELACVIYQLPIGVVGRHRK